MCSHPSTGFTREIISLQAADTAVSAKDIQATLGRKAGAAFNAVSSQFKVIIVES